MSPVGQVKTSPEGVPGAVTDPTRVSAEEIAWMNTYHAWVNTTLAPLVDPETRGWLEAATGPITR